MNLRQPVFIAGTDTGVGKTLVSCALLAAANQRGMRSLGLKPIAAGAEQTPEGLRNEDAVAIAETMSVKLPYQQVNPVCLEPPIAPHIAAKEAGKRVTIAQLTGYCRGALMNPADLKLIEGAGGWLVPVNERETLAELAKELNCGVILVVGMRLGCLNHALLSARAIVAEGLPLLGWVANTIDPEMPRFAENLATLQSRLAAPCLGVIPYMDTLCPVKTSTYLDNKILFPS